MGEGLYTGIGFGAVLTKAQRKALFDEDGDLREELDIDGDEGPRTAYESEDDYVCYFIADSTGFCGSDERFAVNLSRLAEDAKKRYPKEYKEAKKKWTAFIREAAKIGVALPEDNLIFVQDYD